jgi:hypothetical protein
MFAKNHRGIKNHSIWLMLIPNFSLSIRFS